MIRNGASTLKVRLRVFACLAIWKAVLVGCERRLMPTPNLYLSSETDPFADGPHTVRFDVA